MQRPVQCKQGDRAGLPVAVGAPVRPGMLTTHAESEGKGAWRGFLSIEYRRAVPS